MKRYIGISNVVTCSRCGSGQYEIINSRRDILVRRRRNCLNCGNRITTYEISKEDFEKLISVKGKVG